jgi:chemotaxis protein methyltransferase CheR
MKNDAPSSHAYSMLSNLLEKHTGQILLANRHWRVEMALKPVMRRNSIPDINTLVSLLVSDADEALMRECVEAMINNETCFFRDQANFALLTGPLLDSIRQQRSAHKRIRIWSSACSTGQEAYSIAMTMLENQEKWRGWTVQIVATDVSNGALAQAKSGRYSQFEIQRGLPVMLMLKYFRQDGEEWVASDDLRRKVNFSVHNMLEAPTKLGKFDLILCRNMLMYLCENKRKQVLDQLSDAIVPDGMLVLGAAETVIGQTEKFRSSPEFRGFYETTTRSATAALLRRTA